MHIVRQPRVAFVVMCCIEEYSSKSLTLWGCWRAITLMKALKQTTHCSIKVICLSSLCLIWRVSAEVVSGAPNLYGRRLLRSTYSPRHILSTSLAGIGGDAWLTMFPVSRCVPGPPTRELTGISPNVCTWACWSPCICRAGIC